MNQNRKASEAPNRSEWRSSNALDAAVSEITAWEHTKNMAAHAV